MPPAPIILKGQAKILEPIVTLLMAIYTMLEERQQQQQRETSIVYGIPVTTFQDQFTFYPQVKLVFKEDYETSQEIDNRKIPLEGEITFRLANETEATINEDKAKIIAGKIKTKFVSGTIFTWQKGKIIATYLDKKKGYDFRLRVTNETEARRIIEQTLDIQNHSPEWSRLTIHESKDNFPTIPERKLIYGSMRRVARRRPVRTMKFRYAELHVHNLPEAITLVDTTGYRPSPLISST